MSTISKKFCPICGSENVTLTSSGTTGTYMCNSCGYTGNFPDREIVGRNISKLKNKKIVK